MEKCGQKNRAEDVILHGLLPEWLGDFGGPCSFVYANVAERVRICAGERAAGYSVAIPQGQNGEAARLRFNHRSHGWSFMCHNLLSEIIWSMKNDDL